MFYLVGNTCDVLKINDEGLVTVGHMFGYPGLDIENKCWLILGKYNLKMLVLTCGTNGSYVYAWRLVVSGDSKGRRCRHCRCRRLLHRCFYGSYPQWYAGKESPRTCREGQRLCMYPERCYAKVAGGVYLCGSQIGCRCGSSRKDRCRYKEKSGLSPPFPLCR